MKQLGFFILLSIAFHFLVSTTTLYFAEKFYHNSKLEKPTQIEILEDPNLKSQIEKTKQLIRQLKTTVQKIDSSKAARFESEQTQRVIKETKSANLGLSQNSQPTAHSITEKKVEPVNNEDLPDFMKSRNLQARPPSQASAISTILPNDIQNSHATNLNTDANVHYSFYSRVEDLFYIRWVERVRYHWDHIRGEYKRTVLAGKTWSTTVEVLLTSTGEFHSASIIRSSGQKFFDEAPVFAFSDAKFFPNPPKSKVESDGFVRLRYRFNVNVTEY